MSTRAQTQSRSDTGRGAGSTASDKQQNAAKDASSPAKTSRKKKKRVVNEAQSQVMDESGVRFYLDQLTMKHISQSELKSEYNNEIPEDRLNDYFIRLRADLDRSYGNPELVKLFFETKAWIETDQWKNESVQWKEQQYRDRVFGTTSTFDPKSYDPTKDSDDDNDRADEDDGNRNFDGDFYQHTDADAYDHHDNGRHD